MTLHPRVYLSPANFSAMVLPFWLFMARNLYVETGNVRFAPLLFCLRTAAVGCLCGAGGEGPGCFVFFNIVVYFCAPHPFSARAVVVCV